MGFQIENGLLEKYAEESDVKEVVIPDSVTAIGDYAFAWCSSLTSIVIPESVTAIGDGAFGDCSSLTSIVIPDSVTAIGDYAFVWCSRKSMASTWRTKISTMKSTSLSMTAMPT